MSAATLLAFGFSPTGIVLVWRGPSGLVVRGEWAFTSLPSWPMALEVAP
jgi:hypothetical protein